METQLGGLNAILSGHVIGSWSMPDGAEVPSVGAAPQNFTRITISKTRLVAGEPAYRVGDEWWDGFTANRGVIFICAEDGESWIEFHGDAPNLVEGGSEFPHPGDIDPDRDLEHIGHHLMIPGMVQRLKDNRDLKYGAVILPRAVNERPNAVAFYTATQHGIWGEACGRLRFAGTPTGIVRSATVKPPYMGHPEPLNFWLETESRYEVQ